MVQGGHSDGCCNTTCPAQTRGSDRHGTGACGSRMRDGVLGHGRPAHGGDDPARRRARRPRRWRGLRHVRRMPVRRLHGRAVRGARQAGRIIVPGGAGLPLGRMQRGPLRSEPQAGRGVLRLLRRVPVRDLLQRLLRDAEAATRRLVQRTAGLRVSLMQRGRLPVRAQARTYRPLFSRWVRHWARIAPSSLNVRSRSSRFFCRSAIRASSLSRRSWVCRRWAGSVS